VFLVICLLPPVAVSSWSSARGGNAGGAMGPLPCHTRPRITHAAR
jgi:hypothetical protein